MFQKIHNNNNLKQSLDEHSVLFCYIKITALFESILVMSEAKKYYLSENVFVDFKQGIKNNCFFVFPSLVYVKYRQNTWASETCSFVFSWLCFFFQINKTRVNKDLSYSLTQDFMETINEILLNHDYFIKDDRRLRTVLSDTDCKELVLLCKNLKGHPYLTQIVLSTLLHYNDCIEKKTAIISR